MFCFYLKFMRKGEVRLNSILYQDVERKKIVILFIYRYLIERDEDEWFYKAKS